MLLGVGGLDQRFPKCAPWFPWDSRIRGYISVIAALKFTYCFNQMNNGPVKNGRGIS